MIRLFLLFIFSAQLAFAQDCDTMNLVTAPDSPFQKIPVYDQDGTDICYVYVASELIDYQQVKAGKPKSVHPLWAAVKYAEKKNHSNLAIGTVRESIQAIQSKGNCSYETIHNSIGAWAKKAQVSDAEIIAFFEGFAPRLKANFAESKKKTSGLSKPTAQDYETAISETFMECSEANWPALTPEIRAINLATSRQMLSALFLKECSQNTIKLQISDPVYEDIHGPEVSGVLDKKLTELKAPLALNFCSEVLETPRHGGLNTTGYELAEGCSLHTALVVGKKKVENSCHFLIRNSWGAGFNDSTKKWKCLCKHRVTKEFVDDCTNETHNNGQYTVEGCWMNSEFLKRNTEGMTYLKKP